MYEGINNLIDCKIAIKIFKPIENKKIYREIKMMKTLVDCPGIAHFINYVKDALSPSISIVLFLSPH